MASNAGTFSRRATRDARALLGDLGERGEAYARAYVAHTCSTHDAGTYLWTWKNATNPIRTEHATTHMPTRARSFVVRAWNGSLWTRTDAHAWRARQYARAGVGL